MRHHDTRDASLDRMQEDGQAPSTACDPVGDTARWAAHLATCFGNDFPLAGLPAVPPPSARTRAAAKPAPPTAAPTARSTPARPGNPATTSAPEGDRPARPTPPAEPVAADSGIREPEVADTPHPAAEATSLVELAAVCASCSLCKLSEHRNKVVFGEGDPSADVMFVGEAPGGAEDRQGRPFVGPAGQLLTRIIENAMGVARSAVFIANVNKCRPPGNRDPEPDEVGSCLPFLRRQIEFVEPKVIVALGRISANNLLGYLEPKPMRRLRGDPTLTVAGVPLVATWHPAYLLRNGAAKSETWSDIKRVNRLLGRPEVPPPWRG